MCSRMRLGSFREKLALSECFKTLSSRAQHKLEAEKKKLEKEKASIEAENTSLKLRLRRIERKGVMILKAKIAAPRWTTAAQLILNGITRRRIIVMTLTMAATIRLKSSVRGTLMIELNSMLKRILQEKNATFLQRTR